MAESPQSITALASRVPRTLPENQQYTYGTAGFRTLAKYLPSVCLRMGMLASLRSQSFGLSNTSGPLVAVGSEVKRSCPAIGVMVTASHNPEDDNGLKLVEPTGEMFDEKWEEVATRVANAKESEVEKTLRDIAAELKIDLSLPSRIILGRDSRVSSPGLAQLVTEGAKVMQCEVIDLGVVTTPQLHFVTRHFNQGQAPSLDMYYKTIELAFAQLTESFTLAPTVVDCANGVGSVSLSKFNTKLKTTLVNVVGGEGKLNHHAGAEFVQKSKALPEGMESQTAKTNKCASVDGDADRLVYFFVDHQDRFRLLDGDKIIALLASYVLKQVQLAGLQQQVTVGVVQTAYANGASSLYIANHLKLPVACTPTGVKYLHHKAQDFDIGIYFEANGHGTVIFSPHALEHITAKNTDENALAEAKKAAGKLLSCSRLVSQCTGDAVADLFMVEAALAEMGWDLHAWDALYVDLPSCMLKVAVKDRTAVKTTDAERKCVAPAGLQDAIDKLVASGPTTIAQPESEAKSAVASHVRRAFVRPSGTEDVVRVYAEGSTQEEANALAKEICDLVKQFCS